MALGLSGLFPGLHYFYIAGYEETVNYGSWLIVMALWYLAGGVIYAMRIPERIFPGRFDVLVSSFTYFILLAHYFSTKVALATCHSKVES